jgi:hypothetical protein
LATGADAELVVSGMGAVIFAAGLSEVLEQLIARNSTTAITVAAPIAGKYKLTQLSASICLKFWFPLPCVPLIVVIFPSQGLHREKWHGDSHEMPH